MSEIMIRESAETPRMTSRFRPVKKARLGDFCGSSVSNFSASASVLPLDYVAV